jgi:Zn-dependent peptidase ImmA (M78 family)
MVSGVVGSNTHRKLDPREFRGFALADDYAPLVFINGADAKSAQIFTLAHELAHIGLGGSAVSDSSQILRSSNSVEQWCNQVAAELLVPINALKTSFDQSTEISQEIDRLARVFRVSRLVVLRRLVDAALISWARFSDAYDKELQRGLERRETTGGDFYNTLPVRVSKKFAKAVIESTLDGRTLHRDAMRLLGFKSSPVFDELSHRLGFA